MNAMDPDSFALMSVSLVIIVIICVGGPIWLISQYIKSRAVTRLSSADSELIARIAGIADRMDRRMAAVEQILDADAPSWRAPAGAATFSATGGQYERRVG